VPGRRIVDDNLELRLVVEGQHLHDDSLHDDRVETRRPGIRRERAELELVPVAARSVTTQARRAHDSLKEALQARCLRHAPRDARPHACERIRFEATA